VGSCSPPDTHHNVLCRRCEWLGVCGSGAVDGSGGVHSDRVAPCTRSPGIAPAPRADAQAASGPPSPHALAQDLRGVVNVAVIW
jgi:hypothetical protein